MPDQNELPFLYHYQGTNNHLADIEEVDMQLSEVSGFLLKANALRSKNLAVFIGSGCSLPGIPQMGKTMQDILSRNSDIKDEVEKFIESEDTSQFTDIESLLNWLQSGIQFEKDEGEKNRLKSIFNEIKREFIETIPVYGDDKYKSNPATLYNSFYKKIFSLREGFENKLSIFTTNYDLFNEYALEHNNVFYTTGFTSDIHGKFDINQFKYRLVDDTNRYKDKWQPVQKSANLFKIHGSINWLQKDGEIYQTNTHTDDENIVIYPTLLKHKETAQSPYSELFREFANCLQKPNTTLIVMGYGFPDEHINNVISQNLRNPDFNLIIFGDIKEENLKVFYEQYKDKQNIHVIGGEYLENRNKIKAHYFNNIVEKYLAEKSELGEQNA